MLCCVYLHGVCTICVRSPLPRNQVFLILTPPREARDSALKCNTAIDHFDLPYNLLYNLLRLLTITSSHSWRIWQGYLNWYDISGIGVQECVATVWSVMQSVRTSVIVWHPPGLWWWHWHSDIIQTRAHCQESGTTCGADMTFNIK